MGARFAIAPESLDLNQDIDVIFPDMLKANGVETNNDNGKRLVAALVEIRGLLNEEIDPLVPSKFDEELAAQKKLADEALNLMAPAMASAISGALEAYVNAKAN